MIESGEELNNIEKIDENIEIVQEFSRTRFAQRHTEDLRYTRTVEYLQKMNEEDNQTSELIDVPDETGRTERLRRLSLPDLEKRLNGVETWTNDDIPYVRERWFRVNQDILTGTPEKLPPFRGINHHIPLIEDKKQYNYYLPRCPDALKPQLMEKIEKYTRAGWWEPKTVPQAAPMLCIPKKNGKLRTVIDCRKRNDNTLKDVTPFPEQDQIRLDVAKAKYRSKIDMSDAYEQIRIEPEDVDKTAFATVYGTFISHTMQQGDCNAPATFQRLMTMTFREFIGRFVHVYLDDIFVFSNSVKEHENHLKLVFDQLRSFSFYLQESKCQLYALVMDCLGHRIDDQGLHCDTDKLARIRNWREPRTYLDVQRFLGLVQYLSHFLPDISAYTRPLATMVRNGKAFEWRPIHQSCFDMIKAMTAKTLVLKPVDPLLNEPIWLICDASVSGVGAMYGQGPTWQQCRPAGFMSKKFTSAQHHYRVFELETLGILEGLLKWEDKLLCIRIHVVTDHKSLEFFKTQRKLSSRQARWMEYLSRFDFDIRYVKGETNKVADALSRYFESDTWEDTIPPEEFVNADVRLDPDLDDVSWDREIEVKTDVVCNTYRNAVAKERLVTIKEVVEERDLLAAELAANAEPEPEPDRGSDEDDPTVFHSRDQGPPLRTNVEGNNSFLSDVIASYPTDAFFKHILAKLNEHSRFFKENDLLFCRNQGDEIVLCVPKGVHKDTNKSLRGLVIESAHAVVGHFGPQKTSDYVRRWYWWSCIYSDVTVFCKSCKRCQQSKAMTLRPFGLLHGLPIPNKPWESIAMDFVGPFPEVEGHNYLWVVLCRLTSMVHLIPVNTSTKATELSWLFLREVIRLHGLPVSLVSDRDSKFTSRWWREVHRLLGVKLLMSTAFHPQTDGASERVIQSVTQILRTVVRADQKDWLYRLPMTEFAINSSINSSTGYAPFFLNGGHIPSMIRDLGNLGVGVPGVAEFAKKALLHLMDAHDALIEARGFQTVYANRHRMKEPLIKDGDLVYLSTKNLWITLG